MKLRGMLAGAVLLCGGAFAQPENIQLQHIDYLNYAPTSGASIKPMLNSRTLLIGDSISGTFSDLSGSLGLVDTLNLFKSWASYLISDTSPEKEISPNTKIIGDSNPLENIPLVSNDLKKRTILLDQLQSKNQYTFTKPKKELNKKNLFPSSFLKDTQKELTTDSSELTALFFLPSYHPVVIFDNQDTEYPPLFIPIEDDSEIHFQLSHAMPAGAQYIVFSYVDGQYSASIQYSDNRQETLSTEDILRLYGEYIYEYFETRVWPLVEGNFKPYAPEARKQDSPLPSSTKPKYIDDPDFMEAPSDGANLSRQNSKTLLPNHSGDNSLRLPPFSDSSQLPVQENHEAKQSSRHVTKASKNNSRKKQSEALRLIAQAVNGLAEKTDQEHAVDPFEKDTPDHNVTIDTVAAALPDKALKKAGRKLSGFPKAASKTEQVTWLLSSGYIPQLSLAIAEHAPALFSRHARQAEDLIKIHRASTRRARTDVPVIRRIDKSIETILSHLMPSAIEGLNSDIKKEQYVKKLLDNRWQIIVGKPDIFHSSLHGNLGEASSLDRAPLEQVCSEFIKYILMNDPPYASKIIDKIREIDLLNLEFAFRKSFDSTDKITRALERQLNLTHYLAATEVHGKGRVVLDSMPQKHLTIDLNNIGTQDEHVSITVNIAFKSIEIIKPDGTSYLIEDGVHLGLRSKFSYSLSTRSLEIAQERIFGSLPTGLPEAPSTEALAEWEEMLTGVYQKQKQKELLANIQMRRTALEKAKQLMANSPQNLEDLNAVMMGMRKAASSIASQWKSVTENNLDATELKHFTSEYKALLSQLTTLIDRLIVSKDFSTEAHGNHAFHELIQEYISQITSGIMRSYEKLVHQLNNVSTDTSSEAKEFIAEIAQEGIDIGTLFRNEAQGSTSSVGLIARKRAALQKTENQSQKINADDVKLLAIISLPYYVFQPALIMTKLEHTYHNPQQATDQSDASVTNPDLPAMYVNYVSEVEATELQLDDFANQATLPPADQEDIPEFIPDAEILHSMGTIEFDLTPNTPDSMDSEDTDSPAEG